MSLHDSFARTAPALAEWTCVHDGYRGSEVSARIGDGDALWDRATADLLRWRVKTRSGFAVRPEQDVVPGARPHVIVRAFGIREPVEVVEVVRETDRVGFAYRTLPGHPLDGEEAFVLSRDEAGIRLTVRSLSRPSSRQPWRALVPVLRLAQRVTRRRYLRALG